MSDKKDPTIEITGHQPKPTGQPEEQNPPTVSTIESPLPSAEDDQGPIQGEYNAPDLNEYDLTPHQLQFAKLFIDKGCMRTAAYKAIGKCGKTIRQWEVDNPDFKQALFEAKEGLIDWAESALFKKIKKGTLPAIIFFLKCQGKHRGYVERPQVDIESQMKKINDLVNEMARTIKQEIKDEAAREKITERMNQALNQFLS